MSEKATYIKLYKKLPPPIRRVAIRHMCMHAKCRNLTPVHTLSDALTYGFIWRNTKHEAVWSVMYDILIMYGDDADLTGFTTYFV